MLKRLYTYSENSFFNILVISLPRSRDFSCHGTLNLAQRETPFFHLSYANTFKLINYRYLVMLDKKCFCFHSSPNKKDIYVAFFWLNDENLRAFPFLIEK